MSRNHVDLLIEAVLAGQATAAEHAELDDWLRQSPKYRAEYLNRSALHLDLIKLFPANEQSRVKDVPVRLVPRRRSYRLLAGILVAGIMILVSAFVRDRHPPHGPDRQVADQSSASDGTPVVVETKLPTVAATDNAEIFGEGFTPRPGEDLELDRVYVLTHGAMAVEFASGARALLSAPCVFSPTGTESLLVRSGSCSVHAPPGAEGFLLTTPSADVVDLGTRFVIDVAESGETDLLVVDGAATFSAIDDQTGSKLLLRDGDSARIEPDQPPRIGAVPPTGLHYLENLRDRVIRYDATVLPGGFADELLSVTVQRGGEARVYPRDQLTQGKLTHFNGRVNTALCTTRQGENLPDGTARLDLLNTDWSLVTGIINPRSPVSESGPDLTAPIFAIEFDPPVVNGPGPDVLLFDLQLLVYPKEGDVVRVVSGDPGRSGLLEINQFDVDLASRYALDLVPHKTFKSQAAITSVEELATGDFHHGRQTHVNAKGLVAGIDLSKLGYAAGESLRRLVFLETGESYGIDPVLIVGLPGLSDL